MRYNGVQQRQDGSQQLIKIYTDGSALGNPGPGGWAAIVVENGDQRALHGREADVTTNNRMEMLAVIEGLKSLPAFADVTVVSDSTYVVNTMTKGWKRKANNDFWNELDHEVAKRNVGWKWVKGHDGHPLNEKADKLARAEASGKAPPEGGSLSHVNESGDAQMVDVSAKRSTARVAVARGLVRMQQETLDLIKADAIEKGDVLGTARLAGVMGAKQTANLIPLTHPLPIDQVTVEFVLNTEDGAVEIEATAKTTAKTGVEMEALTAVSVAALTIYDMCKAVDRGMRIESVRLAKKTGGKSGDVVLEQV